MFDSIAGLPLHALVIHVVVISIPLATVLALLFVFPRTRNWARWPLALVALGAAASTYVAKQSGLALEHALKIQVGTGPVGTIIAKHSQLANQLFIIMIVFAVVAVASSFLVTRGRPAGKASTATGGQRVLNIGLPIALVIVALVAAFQVYRVGDLGARAVWNPTGTQTFSSGG